MRLVINVIVVLALLGSAAPAAAQCTKDVECKGTRVCHRGECVEPVPVLVTPASTPVSRLAPSPASTSAPAAPVGAPVAPELPAAHLAAEAEPASGVPGGLMVSARRARSSAPPANAGFQLAFRTGYAHPFGSFTGADGDTMGSGFSGQVPLILDFGWKLNRHWFMGTYAGVGLGGTNGNIASDCRDELLTCVSISVRVGALAQYNFLPHRSANPWLGFGLGMEYSGVYWSGTRYSGSVSGLGVELVSLMGGLDFRTSPGFGIGPFLAFSVGTYRTVVADDNGKVASQGVSTPAWHQWFMLGVRMTYRP